MAEILNVLDLFRYRNITGVCDFTGNMVNCLKFNGFVHKGHVHDHLILPSNQWIQYTWVIYQQFQSLQFGLQLEISWIACEGKCGITDQYHTINQ